MRNSLMLLPWHVCCCREQGALEQAAVSAQRQADDLRSRLAEAQSNWQLAQAAADVAEQECTQLLQQVSQELNRASLVEQVSSTDCVLLRHLLGQWCQLLYHSFEPWVTDQR